MSLIDMAHDDILRAELPYLWCSNEEVPLYFSRFCCCMASNFCF
jgi:hypothetical protein